MTYLNASFIYMCVCVRVSRGDICDYLNCSIVASNLHVTSVEN